jgi:hypothetical protein
MNFSAILRSTKSTKGISLYTVSLLSTLAISGFLASPGVISAENSGSSPPTQSSSPITSAAPTYFGSSAGLNSLFLSGPFSAPSAFGPPPTNPFGNPTAAATTSGDVNRVFPDHGLKPAVAQAVGNPTLVDPPHSACSTSGSGCQSVSQDSGGAQTNPIGLNAVPNRLAYGFNIEPPDQGLCANSQFVVESLNIGIVQVYSASTLQPVANGFATLDNLLGLPSHASTPVPNHPLTGWSSGGDIMCNFDSANGGHWIFTEFVSTTSEPAGFFTGCVPGLPDTCREGIAVSKTSDPTGAYWVYFLDPNFVNKDPGSGTTAGTGTMLNDFTKTGLTKNAFLLFYNEYNDVGPGLGGGSGFNGAQEFAFSKISLETGAPAGSVKVAYENMAVAPNIYPIPANGGFQPGPGICDPNAAAPNFDLCWAGVIPAQTPDSSQYDNSNGGTAWMVASLDLIGFGDNRVATFTFTGLCNLDSTCASPTTVKFGGTLYTTPQIVYMDEGFACPIQFGGFCGLATQKAGPIPLGDNCGFFGDSAIAVSCPEGGIATNGDGTTQASYAHGHIWTAVSTSVTQNFGDSSEVHVGAAFWAIGSSSVSAGGIASAAHEDITFPSIAATDGGSALMSFTLSGPDYFPSSAFTWLTAGQQEGDNGDNGGSSGTIHVTAAGKAPADGFTEYLFYPNNPNFRPRWGDYGAAIFVPSHDGKGNIYFASEYVQSPNCSDQQFLGTVSHGIRCDGTRTTSANWGSSINSIASS